MRTQTPSPTPCASRSRHFANDSANPGSSPPWPASATASPRHPAPDVRERTVDRAPGLSVRLKLTLSYAGFLMLAGVLLLAAVWLAGQNRRSFEFLDGAISATGGLVPGNSNFLLRTIAPAAVIVLVFLLVFGLLGGWLLAGRMLAPLARITDATRMAATGSLSHRIELEGRKDEFRELADAFDTTLARLEAHLAEERGLTIETSGDMTLTIGSHALLLQLTTNLVHNAIVHNLPEQGSVWVTTSVHSKSVELTVENSGEKLSPQLTST